MLTLLYLFAVFLAATVSGRTHRSLDSELDQQWKEWKQKFERSYEDKASELAHRQVWVKNYKQVKEHNMRYEDGQSSFQMALNNLSDLSPKDLREPNYHNHRKTHANHASRKTCANLFDANKSDQETVPDSVDWRTEGYVTDVKNQLPQQCLHSVYYTVTGALEGQWFKKSGKLLTLSEQNLADCCGAGQQQCNGETGQPCSLDAVYRFIKQNGIESLNDYPDTRNYQQCAYNPDKRVATCSGYDFIAPDEKSLKFAVATIGPISVTIDSSQPSFQNYKGGVYNEPKCSNTTADRNLLVVGYGTDSIDGDYWIAKNSWGPEWGEQGYIRLSRNRDNQCGIANSASYPFFSC